MKTPTPKFSVGDTVFVSGYDSRREESQTCPDCLGSGRWLLTTPAGEEIDVRCLTCECGYSSSGRIAKYSVVPRVQEGTVGSVRIDTADERPVAYMLIETGVGSGTVYFEENVFASRDEATAQATRMAKEQQDYRDINAKESREERKSRRPSTTARWHRHSHGLCTEVQKLLSELPNADVARVAKIEKYLRLINIT